MTRAQARAFSRTSTTATGPAGQAPVDMEAYYCAPEEQVLMYDVENEQIRSVLAAADALRDANGNSPAAANGGSGILSSCVVSFSGDVVTVSYTPWFPSYGVCRAHGYVHQCPVEPTQATP